MKVAYVDPSKLLRDPETIRPGVKGRYVGVELGPDGQPTGKVLPQFEVPDTSFWLRRVKDGELRRIDNPVQAPIAPLVTR
jgi:hypothetical protein